MADGALKLLDTDVVFADKFKLDEVLRNLISNALKFSTSNSMVSVRVGFRPLATVSSSNGHGQATGVMAQSSSSRERGSVKRVVNSLTRHTSLLLRGLQTRLLSHQVRKVGYDGSSDQNGLASGPRGGDDSVEAAAAAVAANSRNGKSTAPIASSNAPNVHSQEEQRRGSRLLTGPSPGTNRAPGSVFHDSTRTRDLRKGELIVVVTDIGVGISKENQKLLFQEGMQFDPEKLQTGGGSGFGKHALSTRPTNAPYQLTLLTQPLNPPSNAPS